MKPLSAKFLALALLATSACRHEVAVPQATIAPVAKTDYTLRVQVSGLIAFVPTKDGTGLWALLPHTKDSASNLPANCRDAGPYHVGAVRVNPRFLSPDNAPQPDNAFSVIPLQGEEVQLDLSTCRNLSPTTLDLATVPQVIKFNKDLATVRAEDLVDNPLNIDSTYLDGRIQIANNTITFKDPVQYTPASGPTIDVTWIFKNQDGGGDVSLKPLSQMATSELTCTDDPRNPLNMSLVGAKGKRTIPLYQKKNSAGTGFELVIDVVNMMPDDQLLPLPPQRKPTNPLKHFNFLYYASKGEESYSQNCSIPMTTDFQPTVSGNPYCPFGVFTR
jgi:hypothetical protein